MGHDAINLCDSLISYGDDKHATAVPRALLQLGASGGSCFLGAVDVSTDDAAHADRWERHPEGDEILCVLEGRLLAAIDGEGATEEAVIERGQALIVPRGRWHRLRVLEAGRLLFLTPTAGTELRPHVSAAAGAENALAA